MSSLTKNAVIVLVMGFLFYTYRERIRQALTAAAEVMQEYNDQYNHDLEEENSETDKKED
jgi:TRAP-type C4-dicarboxylate transport system substrate-binding protein